MNRSTVITYIFISLFVVDTLAFFASRPLPMRMAHCIPLVGGWIALKESIHHHP